MWSFLYGWSRSVKHFKYTSGIISFFLKFCQRDDPCVHNNRLTMIVGCLKINSYFIKYRWWRASFRKPCIKDRNIWAICRNCKVTVLRCNTSSMYQNMLWLDNVAERAIILMGSCLILKQIPSDQLMRLIAIMERHVRDGLLLKLNADQVKCSLIIIVYMFCMFNLHGWLEKSPSPPSPYYSPEASILAPGKSWQNWEGGVLFWETQER